MSADSEEQNRDVSNDPQPKPDNKKVQDFTEDWGYQGNPSPRFTPMPYPQLFPPMCPPPFELEKQVYHDYDPQKYPHMNSDRKGQSEVPHMDHIDDDPHRIPVHYPFGYYPPMKYPPQPMFMKYPPPPQQGQAYMVPQNPWYPPRPQQQLMPPFCYYPQSQYDGLQCQNTVSKELQSKVFQLVQYQKVSDFQCNCKKSKCLKLYCECFANNWVCSQSCNCQDCKNRIDNPQERSKAIEEALLRNPDAFAQCFQQKSQTQFSVQQQDKPLKEPTKENSNITRKGCNCKKSGCKKKYCECYSQNLKCSDLCKCEQCLNRTDAEIQAQQDIAQVLNSQDQVNVDIKVNQKSKKIKKVGNGNEDKSDSQKPVVQLKINVNNNSSRKKLDKK
ncbi:unnamed protein product [Paramecium octaurelia]|uniref:CRC domain-containing protein n=1 Tax=Paramecium octaurelia TaxID=43137 RepID=A0A8S1WIS7_PAROT|nr:unnamed protein product [Paramecium octaurelia]